MVSPRTMRHKASPVTGDITALIAWWNMLLPAVGLSSPKPPTAVARRARLYRPMAGSRQLNLRSDNAHNVGSGASGASPWGKLFAIYARIVTTADMSFSELRIVWGRSGLIGTAGFVIVVDQVEQLHIVVAPDQLPEFIEQLDDGEGLLRRPVSGNAEGDGQEQAGGGRFHDGTPRCMGAARSWRRGRGAYQGVMAMLRRATWVRGLCAARGLMRLWRGGGAGLRTTGPPGGWGGGGWCSGERREDAR